MNNGLLSLFIINVQIVTDQRRLHINDGRDLAEWRDVSPTETRRPDEQNQL